jgi:dihydroorotate dehydrogenase (NAD+) catalytic subunit
MVTIMPGTVTVGGVTLENHLLLAAGILGTTGASLSRMLTLGAGGVVTKSIGPEPKDGHAGPCLVVLDDGLLNAMGLPNPSKDFVDELAPLAKKPVIASIFGGTPEEFATVAGWFADKVAGFELNLSCPHAEGYGAAIGTDPVLVEACTRAAGKSGVPVWVKLTPNVTDITVIGKAAERGGAKAIVGVNTVKAMRIATALRRPVLGNRFGGLSGSAMFPVAVRCVYELYEAVKIPIIGCGGIATADNVVEMMMAGARAVEIGSAVQGDATVFEKIKNDLYAKDGIDAEEIVGCAHAS